eukprot:gb/GECH01012757.1/.p1 GENE.gb/GECH01012757.1/~~gb/GECH01012757.1/.p1  ORF type:complete len:106 (+),score=26.70 gb/GECH01012757.1/:1-318(+)
MEYIQRKMAHDKEKWEQRASEMAEHPDLYTCYIIPSKNTDYTVNTMIELWEEHLRENGYSGFEFTKISKEKVKANFHGHLSREDKEEIIKLLKMRSDVSKVTFMK